MYKKPYYLSQLGNGRSTELTWGQYGGKHMIALTITPDPAKHRYGDMPEEEQIQYIKIAVTLTLDKYPQIEYKHGGFEYNKSGNIHFHGLLLLKSTCNPFNFATKVGKYLNSEVGRKRVPWYVAVQTECKDDYDTWHAYCHKEDCVESWRGLRPSLMTIKKTIIDYL